MAHWTDSLSATFPATDRAGLAAYLSPGDAWRASPDGAALARLALARVPRDQFVWGDVARATIEAAHRAGLAYDGRKDTLIRDQVARGEPQPSIPIADPILLAALDVMARLNAAVSAAPPPDFSAWPVDASTRDHLLRDAADTLRANVPAPPL